MQFAQSWGQCWSRKMWNDFYHWYLLNENFDFSSVKAIPHFVRNWSSKSWLKFFIAYIVDENKFFVYPYKSLSTNFGDAGTHVINNNTKSQVPLFMFSKMYSNLPDVAFGVKYDVFFERILDLEQILGLPVGELCIDLYGTKDNFCKKKYWVTCEPKPFFVKKSIALAFRPSELNLIVGQVGRDIFIYDTTISATPPVVNPISLIDYDIRYLSLRKILKLLKSRLSNILFK